MILGPEGLSVHWRFCRAQGIFIGESLDYTNDFSGMNESLPDISGSFVTFDGL